MRILLTGYADKQAIADSINEGEVFRYLTKPCARDTLKETLAMAVSAAGEAPQPANDATIAGNVVPAAVLAVTPPAPRPPPAMAEATAAGSVPAADVAAAPRPEIRTHSMTIDLLVLSSDPEFTGALDGALAESFRLHHVSGVDQAIEVLEGNPIGVFITDMAVNTDEVAQLTTQLKHSVPELVTIVASDHSDAHRLIDLINGGQVFRFLLKPIRPKQTSIWIESAVAKHLELVDNPNLVARHAVAAPTQSLFKLGEGLLRSLAGRMLRLRGGGAQRSTGQ
jgi:serine/threonine-protein kinase